MSLHDVHLKLHETHAGSTRSPIPAQVEDLVAFVPGRTPGGGAKDGVSLTRMIWLPYIWVVERTVAFFRGGWVKSYKVQRVALVVLCLTAALSNYNNKALFER